MVSKELKTTEIASLKDETQKIQCIQWKPEFDILWQMFPSHLQVITCGCLRSLAQLSLQHPPQPREKLLMLLKRYYEPSRRTCVRMAAWKGALHVSASLGGPDRCLACLLECLSNEGNCPSVRLAVLEEALIVLMRFGSKVWQLILCLLTFIREICLSSCTDE